MNTAFQMTPVLSWREHRKTMSWMEWFLPTCGVCLQMRILLAVAVAIAIVFFLHVSPAAAVVAGIAAFGVIGSAANYLPDSIC